MAKPARNIRDDAPDLIIQWHPKLNGALLPEEVSLFAKRKVWWTCPLGHDWEAVVYSRTAGTGCPYCGSRRVGYGNDLETNEPAVAREWHPTKNHPLMARDVLPRSNRKAWWVGSSCQHEWEAVIANRTGKIRAGCPYCANQKVGYGNDLASRFPDVAKEWHLTKNGTRRPDEVTAGARTNAWWQCANGHEWRAMVFKRTAGSSCEKCRLVGLSELEVSVYHELRYVLGQHSVEHDQDVRLKLAAGRRQRVDMLFDRVVIEFDGWFWHQGNEDGDREKSRLLEAAGYTVIRVREQPLLPLSGNDASVRRAPTAVDISVAALQKMGQLSVLPQGAAQGSARYISDRELRAQADTSQALSALKLGDYGARSLASRFPDIALEWHPDLNDRTPHQVTGASGKTTWWLCPAGHEYEAVVGTRTGSGTGCGYCSGRYATTATSMRTLRPDLADQLHPTLNGTITAANLLPYSGKIVWWLCPEGHVTEDTPNDRAKGMLCRQCPGSRRDSQPRARV